MEEQNTQRYSQRYRAWILLVLIGVYTFNFIDRQILVIIQESVKAELDLSDAQLGMLTGLFFAIFYVGLGIPIARYADNNNRRNIVALALAVWSAMTAISGMVANYIQLVMARMGVGIGEAGSNAPSHSIISDYFPPQQRATALAIYSTGIYIGILAGYSIGGWIDATYGWRMAFIALGIPGIIYSLLVLVGVKEPRKGRTDSEASKKAAHDASSFYGAIKHLLSIKTFLFIGLAAGLHTFGNYGVGNFFAPFMARVHQMPVAEIGVYLGLCMGLGGILGTFLGGYLADIVGKKDLRWYLLLPIIASLINYIPSYFAFFSDDKYVALFNLFISSLLTSIYLGPCLAIAHNVVGAKMRALSSAIFFFFLNAIGLGLGPMLVGLTSDLLEPTYGVESIRYAFLITFVTSLLSIVFFYLASRTYKKDALVKEYVSKEKTSVRKEMQPVLNIIVGAFLLFLGGLYFLQLFIGGQSISSSPAWVLGLVAIVLLGGAALISRGIVKGK